MLTAMAVHIQSYAVDLQGYVQGARDPDTQLLCATQYTAVSNKLWRDRLAVRAICSISREVLVACLGRAKVNYNM